MTASTTTQLAQEPAELPHDPPATFATFGLSPALTRALEALAYNEATPIQRSALPALLRGDDVIAQARTGSGKTVAFGLALLTRVDTARAQVQALVLCPTRELADQVAAELRRLARFIANLRVVVLCGGVPVRTQKPGLITPPHVVVGTPGRVLDHLSRGNLDLPHLRALVLDEADRMLDMGFRDQIDAVLAHAPAARQTLLFSATYSPEIRALSRAFQRDPHTVTVDAPLPSAELEQTFFLVDPHHKQGALTALLLHHRPESALIFCHTRADVREVHANLIARGFTALALHGELEQRQRDEVLLRFANKSCAVLVATDVAARGLDIKGLAAVISWELPNDPDLHLHRVGRTGRAGHPGRAFALCTPAERARARALEGAQGPLRWADLPVADGAAPSPPAMTTLMLEGGRQDKLRPGDLLGALTGELGLPAEIVGKIDIHARRSYIAIRRDRAALALQRLRAGKIKGRSYRARALE